MKKTKWIAAAAVMAMVAAFSGCSGALNNELDAPVVSESQYEGMRFAVLLPGNNSRVAYYEESDATKYDVLLEKDGVSVVEEKNKAPGSKVYLPVADEGTYKIKVIAYKNTTVIGEGEETVTMNLSDGDVNVIVTITPKVKEAGVNVGIQWGKPENVNNASVSAVSAITINGVTFEKTGEVQVMNGAVTVTGAKNTNNYEGVFIEGRTVTLSPFIMGKYEVTQELYKTVMTNQKVTIDGVERTLDAEPFYCTEGSGTFTLKNPEIQKLRPAEGMTWFDAVYFCNALTEKTMKASDKAYNITVTDVDSDGNITGATVTLVEGAKGYRLPTEAEWEFAARGGDQTKADWNYTFSGADTASGTSYSASSNTGLDTVGWYDYNNITGTTGSSDVTNNSTDCGITNNSSGCGTHEVGKKAANALELYDMSGNVWEWCYDWYDSVSRGSEANPTGASSGSCRVKRGGGWFYDAYECSVCDRFASGPDNRFYDQGFRVVRSAQ